MENEIRRHQDMQELQGKVNEVFIFASQKKYTAERTMGVLKVMFDSIEDEELERKFRSKSLFLPENKPN